MFHRIKKVAGKSGPLVTGLFITSMVLLLSGTLIFGYLLSDRTSGMAAAVLRIKNYFSFAVLGDKPNFYYLYGEKNGKEIRLTEKEPFQVTYRDEFVIKEVVTDDLFGSETTVDVEGVGERNDFGRLLKGIELVDLVALSSEERPYRILIRYRDAIIAAVPIVVTVSAQDWLRYARSTEDAAAKVRYLKRAIDLNKEDIAVRRMLAAAYEKAGRRGDAAEQLREIRAMEQHGKGATEESTSTRAVMVEGAGHPGKAVKSDAPYVRKGLAYSKAGDWSNAIVNYLEALKQDPDNVQVRYKLGEAYEKSNQIGEAIRQYGIVLDKNPQADYAMMALADVSLKSGQYGEAIKWYGALIKKRPREASFYGNLGLAYGGKGMVGEEIRQYRKALALNPRNTVVLFNMGTAYEKGKNEREAVKAYRQVLRIKPGDADASARLAAIAFKNGNYTEAITIYEKNIKKMGNKAVAYANLGFAYGERKDYRKSAYYYEQAIKSGNKDPQVKTNLAFAKDRIKAGTTGIPSEKRIAVAQKAAAPVKKSSDRKIDRYLKEKKYDLAIAEYQRAIRKDPKNTRYYEGLGDVYGLKGDTNRQIESYRKVLRHGQASSGLYERLGAAYEKKGKLKEALDAYNRAYALNPDSPTAGRRIPRLKIKMLQEKHRGDEE